MDFSVLIYQP